MATDAMPLQDADAPPAQHHRLEFTGSGSEYFRIWIVNLLLSVLTLGIYSAWAKVRRLRYFYRHTRLAGSGFDYHGEPLAILKGRILALGLVLAYSYATEAASQLGVAILLVLAAVLPWLLRSSLRFRLHNSSWRGLRFSFRGTLGESYFVFLLMGGLALATGLLWPLFHSRLKRYQHANSWFGELRGAFSATDGQFYGVYIKASLLWLALVIACLLLAFGPLQELRDLFGGESADQGEAVRGALIRVGVLAGVVLLGGVVLTGPYLMARLQNLVWNHTTLDLHRFDSRLSARRLTWIVLGNFAGIVLTLGLFMPWAAVRLARYRAQCLSLVTAGDLEAIVAAQGEAVAAAGEEAAEFFDIDIAL